MWNRNQKSKIKDQRPWLILILILISCQNSSKDQNGKSTKKKGFTKHILNPTYAKGFTIYENENTVRLTSRNPHDTTEVYKILDFKKSELNYNKIAISSTTHAFLFDALGANDAIIGMSAMSYLQDSLLLATFRKNNVVELGKDDHLNREIIIKTNPEIFMVYPCSGCDYSDYEKAGIIVVNNAEYLEEHPLGRAEWIKVAGLLTGKTMESKSSFNAICKKYLAVKKSTASIHANKSPRVMLGKPIDNVWYVPGNNSFAAKLITDAGCIYAFGDNKGNNVKTQPMEWILSRSADADFWVFTDHSVKEITLTSLKSENKAYQYLNPVKSKQVIACNSAKADFFGKAVIEPDVLLQDLIFHLHHADAGYSPKYFKLLKEK